MARTKGRDKKPEYGSVTKCKSGIAPLMDAPKRGRACGRILTLLAHSLRLRTLNALVLRAAKAGAVDGDAGVRVALELGDIVMAGHLAAELICE